MGVATLTFTIIFIVALFLALESFKRSISLANFVLAWLTGSVEMRVLFYCIRAMHARVLNPFL